MLGVTPASLSESESSIHFLLTGPRGEGRKVMGDRDLLVAQPRLVGEEEGDGEKERLGTGFCMEGEKHCFPGWQEEPEEDLVGEGEGEGDVRGEGKGPTPMVKGTIGSVARRAPAPIGAAAFTLESFESHRDRSSQL